MTLHRLLIALVVSLGASLGVVACVGDDLAPVVVGPDDSGGGGDATVDNATGSEAGADAPGDTACGFTMCSTGCFDLTSNGDNCGACGHSCLGGACIGKTCQPVTLAASPGGGAPKDIKVEGTHVFWTVEALGASGGGVFQANVMGANQTAVAIATGTAEANDNTRAVAAHGAAVYWTQYSIGTDTTRIWQGAVDHATSPVVLDTLAPGVIAYGLALNPSGSHVYTVTLTVPGDTVDSRDCMTASPVMCTAIFPSYMSGSSGPLYIVADASQVYWTDPSFVRVRKALMGGNQAVSDVATSQANIDLLTVNNGFLYWIVTGAINRSPVGSASPEPVISTGNTPSGIAADATNVYWSDATVDRIRYAPAAGAGVAKDLATAHAGRLARDNAAIYWTETGTIKKVALP